MADALIDITTGGEVFTWQQLPDMINALQNGDDVDYEGASGSVEMNQDGDATAEVYDLYRFRGGELDIYSELPVVLPGQ